MKIKVGFLWHNVSSGNLGVGALSISNMYLVKKCLDELNLDYEFITIGDNEVTDKDNIKLVEDQIDVKFSHYSFSVKELIKKPKKMISYHKLIRSLDLVFDVGAGDSFSDIYGFKRFFVQIFTKIHAVSFAKKTILSPQTIGPFYTKKAEFIAKYILKKADYVFARDQLSYNEGCRIVNIDNFILSTDVALIMPFEKNKSINSEYINIGINISGLLWSGGYHGLNDFGLNHSYKEHVKCVIDKFLDIDNTRIYLVSHVIATIKAAEIEDDYLAANEIKNKYYSSDDRVILIDKFTNPIIAKSFISGMDFFTGARMHATIGAFSSNVPVVPYAYSRKFAGLYNTIGYDVVLDAKQLNLNDSVDYVFQNFEKRDELAKKILESKVKLNELSSKYTNSIKAILNSYEY